jgi:hypothetical protein
MDIWSKINITLLPFTDTTPVLFVFAPLSGPKKNQEVVDENNHKQIKSLFHFNGENSLGKYI